MESPPNQQFLIMENEALAGLQKKAAVSVWEKLDENHTVVRLATSWATSRENVEALLELL